MAAVLGWLIKPRSGALGQPGKGGGRAACYLVALFLGVEELCSGGDTSHIPQWQRVRRDGKVTKGSC